MQGSTVAEQIENFMNGVRRRNPGETEFHQAVEEVAATVIPFIQDKPIYQEMQILERMAEPDRIVRTAPAIQAPCGTRRSSPSPGVAQYMTASLAPKGWVTRSLDRGCCSISPPSSATALTRTIHWPCASITCRMRALPIRTKASTPSASSTATTSRISWDADPLESRCGRRDAAYNAGTQ